MSKTSIRDFLLSMLCVLLLALVIGIVYEIEKPQPRPTWHRIDHDNELEELQARKR